MVLNNSKIEKFNGDFTKKETAILTTEEKFMCNSPSTDNGFLYAHSYLKIGFCSDGSGTVKTVSTSYNYKKGTICVIPQNYLHSISKENNSSWQFLFLNVECIVDLIYPNDLQAQKDMLDKINKKAYLANRSECEDVYNLMHLIDREQKQKKAMYKESIRGLCWIMMITIARLSEYVPRVSESMQQTKDIQHLVRPALDYIRSHFAQPLKIEKIAATCHMSESHFRRLFESSVNMTPMEYLNLVRINEACVQIQQNEFTMEEIAERVGYSDTSTFYRNFKKIIGKTPFQWKKTQK